MVWRAAEVAAVRRQALLESLEAMQRQCWQPWARSAAHLALAAAKQHRERFCPCQQERLQALINFLRTSKATGIVRGRCMCYIACAILHVLYCMCYTACAILHVLFLLIRNGARSAALRATSSTSFQSHPAVATCKQ